MPLDVTNHFIQSYLKTIDEKRRPDIDQLIRLMEEVTQRKPKLWGAIIGFGRLYYRYQTGHDGYMPILGLSNRKQAITLYLSFNIEKYPAIKKLGKCTYGKSCLYIKRLADVDWGILKKLIQHAYQDVLKYSFVKVLE
jgi:hypothetical protein